MGVTCVELLGFELRQLEYFVVAAEQNSFSRTAELLFVTQPLISQQISELERQLGVELFVRQHRALRLTPAGAALYPEAKAILARSGALVRSVQACAQNKTPKFLKIGFEQLFDWPLAVQRLVEFQKEDPALISEVQHASYQTIIRELFNGKLDVVFALLPNKSLSRKLRVKVIGHSSIHLAAGRCQSAGLSREEFIARLDRQPLYLLNGDYRGTNSAIQACVSLNVSPQFCFLDSMQSIILNVAAGNGYAYFPEATFRTHGGDMLRTEALSHIPEGNLCLAAIWSSASLNPLLPAFLAQFPGERDCCRDCSNACAVRRHALAE